MSPRALTDNEKGHQQQRIMVKARELLLTYGIRKISVDDIVKAAGMAKGSFYNHFANKDDLLKQLVWEVYQGFVDQARTVIESSNAENLRSNVAAFICSILNEPDKVFFFVNHQELEDLIASWDSEELQDFSSMEQRAFAGLITLAGKDVQRVKPGVVHNYIHTMYFAISDDAIAPEFLQETIDIMLKGLINYMFGPEDQHG